MALGFIFVYVTVLICLVTGQSLQYGLKGQEGKLTADITGQPDGILWKHDNNKVVEFNGNQEKVFDPFQDRITLDWHSAQLTITDLRFEDSGWYDLEVYVNKKLSVIEFRLEVIEKVAMPTISCEMNDGTSDNISATLDCSVVPTRQSVQLEWISHGKVQSGPKLTIKLGDAFDDEEYTCKVSNRLSAEKATFNAKDCYPDQSLSVAQIITIVLIFVVLFALVVSGSIIFCKQRHKACFAEGHKDDLEQVTQGSDETRPQSDESTTLLDRAPTLPSTQRLSQLRYPDNVNVSGLENSTDEHETPEPPPSAPNAESESPSDLDNDSNSNNKGDADGDQLCNPAVEDCSNVPDTIAVTANLSEGGTSDLESFTALKNPGTEEDANEDGEANLPTPNGVLPTAQPHSPPSLNSPNVMPKDSAGEPDEDSNPDQINGEATTSFRESDSSGIGKTNDSDNSSEDEQSTTIPEQKGSEASLHERESKVLQGEAHTYEDNQQEMDRPASAAENKADSVGHDEELEEPNLYLATDEQPQSPTPTKADNGDIDTSQDFADATHFDSDQEEEAKTGNDSDEDEGESDENQNKFLHDPKEEKPGQ